MSDELNKYTFFQPYQVNLGSIIIGKAKIGSNKVPKIIVRNIGKGINTGYRVSIQIQMQLWSYNIKEQHKSSYIH